jgi:hypothetical protein
VIRRIVSIALLFLLPMNAMAAKKDKKKEAKEKPAKEVVEKTKRPKYEAFSENSVGFRGVGEVWQESAIVMVHRSSRFGATGFFHTGISRLFGVELELGYTRLKGKAIDPATNQRTGNTATLELVPISMDTTIRVEGPTSEVLFGIGPAFVSFNDRSPTNAISGMKIGLDMRVAMRIHTHFIQQSMRPGARGMKRMDFELLLGRRQHQAFGVGSGLDLSAWRVGAGFVGRL